MSYRADSVEGRFLRGEPEAVGLVFRWISRVLTLPRFWALREEWADLHQEVLGRVTESLRENRFDDEKDFRTYVQGVARFTAMTLAPSAPELARSTRWPSITCRSGASGAVGSRSRARPNALANRAAPPSSKRTA